jgi:hypothetical protein
MANTPSKSNPAQESGELSLPPGYRPMSVGQRRLEVPEKEGWHRHWFRGNPGNIAKARQAGYRFVEKDEVTLNDFDIAGDDEGKGTDLGTRVSVSSGDGPERLYLMECPERLFQYAQSLHMDQVHQTAEALKGGMIGRGKEGETKDDTSKRYSEVNVKGRNLLTRKS